MKDVFTTTEQPLAKEKKETEVKEETKETIKEDKEIYASYNINGIYGNVQYSFKLEKDDFVNQNYKKCILNDIYDSLKYQFEVEIKNNNGKTLDYIEEKGLPYFLSKDEYFKMAQLQGYKGTVYLGHNK
jgi:hypothetical protein